MKRTGSFDICGIKVTARECWYGGASIIPGARFRYGVIGRTKATGLLKQLGLEPGLPRPGHQKRLGCSWWLTNRAGRLELQEH